MANQNWYEKFLTNPISVNLSGDLLYFARSPYGFTDDAVISWDDFAAQFATPSQVQQSEFNFAIDSGAVNAYVVTLDPIPASYTDGFTVIFTPSNTNTIGNPTINVNGLGAIGISGSNFSLLRAGDIIQFVPAVIIYNADDGSFQLQNPQTSNSVIPKDIQDQSFIYAVDSGVADAYAITLSPAPSAYVDGMSIWFRATHDNTGASTINVNGLGATTIATGELNNLNAGDIRANVTYNIVYSSATSAFIMQSNYISKTDLQNQAFTFAADSGAADAYVLALSPAISSYSDGQQIIFATSNPNTGASTVNAGPGVVNLVNMDGSSLSSGAILSGPAYIITYNAADGVFNLANSSASGGGGVTSTQVQQTSFNSGNDSGAADAYAVTLSPAVGSYTNGLIVYVNNILNSNTSPTPTLNVNGLGDIQILSANNGVLSAGDITAGQNYMFVYNSANNVFIINYPANFNETNLIYSNFITVVDSGAANAYVGTNSLFPTFDYSNAAPVTFLFYCTHTNTSSSTLDINGIGALPIKDFFGNALKPGALQANSFSWMYIDSSGTFYVLMTPANTNSKTVIGTSTNDNATAGYIGEYVESIISSGSAVSVSNTTATNVTSISLTAGDWDVNGNVSISFSGVATQAIGCINTTSATLPDQSLFNGPELNTGSIGVAGVQAPYKRISVASTTTVYLIAYANFSTGACNACGGIYARRAR